MKKIASIILYLILYIAGTVANWEAFVGGKKASVIGFSLSLLFAWALLVLPVWAKKEKLFLRFSLIFSGLLFLGSVVGILSKIIEPLENLGMYAVIPVSAFGGLGYLLPDNTSHAVIIVLTLISCIVSALILFKKDKAES